MNIDKIRTLKVVDVEFIRDFKLDLTFNNEILSRVDLYDIFNKSPFKQFKNKFTFFGLLNGNLVWYDDNDNEYILTSHTLYELSYNKKYIKLDTRSLTEMAIQDSINEGDVSIFVSALSTINLK